jgi:hypothetical protein
MTKITLSTMPRRVKLAIILIGLFGTFVFAVPFGIIYGDYIIGFGTSNWFLLFLGCVVATIPLHEGMHGLFFRLYGGKVKFGAKLRTTFGPVFWATSEKMFPRRQFQTISLAPQILTVVLGALVALGSFPAIVQMGLIIVAVGNLFGGAFDIYLAILLRGYPSSVMVRDIQDGLEVCYQ